MEGMVEWREEIDEINSEIMELLSRRTEVVKKVGEYKKERGIPITDIKREGVVFERIERLAEEKGVNKELAKELFEKIIKQAKKDEE